jgi:hypothetical protein
MTISHFNKPAKRILNKKYQKEYYDSHEYDEYIYHKSGFIIPRHQVHEILFGSRKTYEPWNMISLTQEIHDQCHREEISKRELFLIKIKNGYVPPRIVLIEFDLMEAFG